MHKEKDPCSMESEGVGHIMKYRSVSLYSRSPREWEVSSFCFLFESTSNSALEKNLNFNTNHQELNKILDYNKQPFDKGSHYRRLAKGLLSISICYGLWVSTDASTFRNWDLIRAHLKPNYHSKPIHSKHAYTNPAEILSTEYKKVNAK